MPAFLAITRLSLREAIRRRALTVVAAVTFALLGLLAAIARIGLGEVRARGGNELQVELAGAGVLATGAFATLLLAAVLAAFLTSTAVRGDADRGLLQHLLVRPVPRAVVVLARLAAGAAIAFAYALLAWSALVASVAQAGGWAPERWLAPGLTLAAAAALVAVVSTAASALLPGTAAGLATLALVGIGFTIGLLGQAGDALEAERLSAIADALSWLLPFEALYRDAVGTLAADVDLVAGDRVLFGGAHDAGPLLLPWAAGWGAVVAFAAIRRAAALDV